jgi:hypothetical protein
MVLSVLSRYILVHADNTDYTTPGIAGFEVLSHLFLEHLFEDDLHALADSGFDIQLHVVFELAFRGQVPPFSLETHKLPDAIVSAAPLARGALRVAILRKPPV